MISHVTPWVINHIVFYYWIQNLWYLNMSVKCKRFSFTNDLNQGRNLFFFPFIFISWRLIILQYCSGFCHILTWISYGFTCVPHPEPLWKKDYNQLIYECSSLHSRVWFFICVGKQQWVSMIMSSFFQVTLLMCIFKDFCFSEAWAKKYFNWGWCSIMKGFLFF